MPPETRIKRGQRGTRRARISPVVALRRAVNHHVKKHLVLYVPALLPVIFFLLAHFVTVLALVFIKSGLLGHEQLIHKTVVTWAVYGFLPLLLCSYCCFFAVARPVAGVVERTFPQWPIATHTLSAGGAYGAATGILLVLLLGSATWVTAVFLFLVGMIVGQGNWFVYRKLTVAAA